MGVEPSTARARRTLQHVHTSYHGSPRASSVGFTPLHTSATLHTERQRAHTSYQGTPTRASSVGFASFPTDRHRVMSGYVPDEIRELSPSPYSGHDVSRVSVGPTVTV